MVSWFGRLIDMAPLELPERGGPGLLEDLDAAYEGLTTDELLLLSGKYRFDYVIRSSSIEGDVFDEVYRNGPWWIYRRAPPVEPPEEADQDPVL